MKVYVKKYCDEFNWYSKYLYKYIDVIPESVNIYNNKYYLYSKNTNLVIPSANIDKKKWYRTEKIKNILKK
jgi:hypothetical protein